MGTKTAASVPAFPSKNRIRTEASVVGESFSHEGSTDGFLGGIQVRRRDDEVEWRMDASVSSRATRTPANVRHRLAMLLRDAQAALVEPILEELQ